MCKLLAMHWEHLSEKDLKQYPDHKILLIESYAECRTHKHHKKKLVFFISAMRHFYEQFKDKYDIEYIKTELSFVDEVRKYIANNKITEVSLIRPGEYRYYAELTELCAGLGVDFAMREDEKFICSMNKFTQWANRYQKKLLMEHFYRFMRLETGILVENGKPVEGKWNFDKENRKAIPKGLFPPQFKPTKPDKITQEVIELVESRFADHFGDIHPFWMEVTQSGAEQVLQDFIKNSLPHFGQYQDAMQEGEALLFHSGISAYLNIGFLDPLQVCKEVVNQYPKVLIQNIEGFIRQILGWREFIRGIYWTKMPEYKKLNHLEYNSPLPDLYWAGETDCNCLKQVVLHTKKYAYSHHIQRLMVTGNFAALIGVHPGEICEWYLCVYADAYEWVELPNTLGMATYSDGGIVGTKPYIASGAYINKMSDFCKGCKYKYDKREGEDACPFNYLYWNFLITHADKLKGNHRMGIMNATAAKMPEEEKVRIKELSSKFMK